MTLAAILVGALAPLTASGPASAQTVACAETFDYSGSLQSYTVPTGVTSIIVDAYGAEGGSTWSSTLPGRGGYVNATIPVIPGETFYVSVGQAGDTVLTSGASATFGGGGATTAAAGQGGGASDIRQSGSALANRVVVAGGGGGVGHGEIGANGGHGGHPAGGKGANSPDGTGDEGGFGGTQTAGGSRGIAGSSWVGTAATNGSLGQGGSGGHGTGSSYEYYGGGGGGGGYYGGGGGKGGSGLASPTSYADGAGGGGGSSFGPPGTQFVSGVNTGNGKVVLTAIGPNCDDPNLAPAVPDLVFPPEGHVFNPVEAQAFTINSVDPEGDQYMGRVRASSAGGDVETFDTAPAQSGFDATGVPTTPLPADMWQWQARAFDTRNAFSPLSDVQGFGVASADLFASDTCSDPVVDGYLGAGYTRVATESPDPDTSHVCVRLDYPVTWTVTLQGEERTVATRGGGRLEVRFPEGSGPVEHELAWDATCDGDDDALLPDPLLAGESGDPDDPPYAIYRADTVRSGNSVSLCVRVGTDPADDDNLLALRVTAKVPSTPDVPQVSFVPDVDATHRGLETPNPAPFSSECQTEATGTATRVVNARFLSKHVWLYGWDSDSNTAAKLCFRVDDAAEAVPDADGTGGRLLVDASATGGLSPVLATPSGTPAHDDPDCPTQMQHLTSPLFLDLHRSATGSNPASVCLSVASTHQKVTVGTSGTATPPEVDFDAD